MKILQTLATDNFDDSLNATKNTQTLLYHFMSIESIRKTYGPDQEIILVTDTKGKELIEKYNFPYSSITTALDDYPFSRPLSLCGYKGYTLSLYPDDDVIHVDNDVFIKKRFPTFTDTIVQSHEGNLLNYTESENCSWNVAFKDILTISLPEILTGRMNSIYNPGVIGFKANSVVRAEYISTHNTYLNTNTLLLKALSAEVLKSSPVTLGRAYISTVLEEAVLYNLCQDNSITPTFVLNSSVVGVPPVYDTSRPDLLGEFYGTLLNQMNNFHIETGYLHPFHLKNDNKFEMLRFIGDLDSDSNSTYIPYVAENIIPFITRRYGATLSPSNEEINSSIRAIVLI